MNQIHSQKRILADILYQEMLQNPDIFILTGDLGYKMWDAIQTDFPDRFINTGAAEQVLVGLGVGLALAGKIPVVYSITPFLLYRPFETIRNYVNHEEIPVKLIGAGLGRDYTTNGFSHWAEEDRQVMQLFPNIHAFWPETVGEIKQLVPHMLKDTKPYYINLTR